MLTEQQLQALVRVIHSYPELNGVSIMFYGNSYCRMLHPGVSVTLNSARVAVIIEESTTSDQALIRELQQWASAPAGSPEGAPNPAIVTNRSRLGTELIGAGLSCGLTVVSAVGVVGGAAAEVPSAGTSTFLVVAAWAGLVTQGIQCLNGIARVSEIMSAPTSASLEEWDRNPAYRYGILIVDAVGVASGLASLPAASRNLWGVLSRQRSFVARGITVEGLRQMNRAGRMRLISELVEEASRTPEGRAAIIAAAREAGIGAQSIQSTTGLSVRHADTLVRIIRQETVVRLTSSLRDVLGTVAGVTASATPDRYIGSASGSVNFVINLVDTGAAN